MSAFISLTLFMLLSWFWFDTLRAREAAFTLCAEICTELQVQLLDDTVALAVTRLQRHSDGNLAIQRMYYFEFFAPDNGRHQGTVWMRNATLEMVEVPGYMNRTISLV